VAEQLQWNVTVRAVGGPQIGSTGAITLDAYDKLAISVPKKGTPDDGHKVSVDLAPAGEKVALLVVRPTKGDELVMTIDGNDVAVDGPLVLLGKGAVSLLSDATTLELTNNDTQAEAVLDILVGREAT
jgi:hypothetical protein